MKILTVLTSYSCFFSALAVSIPLHSHDVQSLYQFQPGSWIENVAVKDSDAVIVTDFTQNRIFEVSTPSTGQGIATLLGSLPDVESALGIVQTGEMEFAVLGTNFSTETFTVAPGSSGVYSLKFASAGDTSPSIKKIVTLPGSALVNGAAALAITPTRKAADYILIADSLGGNIIRVDLATGQASNVSSSPLYLGRGSAIGINGIKIDESSSQIYFTNTYLGFGRVSFDAETGNVTSEPEILLRNPVYAHENGSRNITFDDFSLAPSPHYPGSVDAYLTTMTFNSILKASGSDFQNLEIFAGMPNSTSINQPASTFYDPSINAIYITTTGGLETPKDKGTLLGGQVLRVYLSEKQCSARE